MLYKTLTQHNELYDADLYGELDDLYEGGYALQKKAQRYLPRYPGEHGDVWKARMEGAAYINYLGEIIDYYVASIFSQEVLLTQAADAANPDTPGKSPEDPDYYSAFAHDVDLKGTAFTRLLREVATTALLKRRALVCVDLPDPVTLAGGADIMTRADEGKLGLLRAYAYELPPDQVIDWEHDRYGNFSWVIIHRIVQTRERPEDTRSLLTEEFKIWRKDEAAGTVSWELYQCPKRKPEEKVDGLFEVPLVGAGITTFPWIPIVDLWLPKALWVGNKVGCMAREHYQRRSKLLASEDKSLFAIPYAKLGPEIGGVGQAMPSEIQQDPHRASDLIGAFRERGFVTIGKDDDLGFAEPGGSAYEIADRQIKELVDEMFRVTHQMASSITNTSSSLGRSGTSKQEDREATEVVLNEFGSRFRSFGKQIYETVSAARGETIIWTPHGLDKYELQDRATILEEATSIPLVPIRSRTFRKIWQTKTAFALLGDIPPDTKETIREEIEAGVDEEGDMNDLLEEAQVKAAQHPEAGQANPEAKGAKPAAPAKSPL